MKKILIATRNNDKFKIVVKLLKTANFKNYEFLSLRDINEQVVDKKEEGSVAERSYAKAKNACDSLINNDFEYIIGIDDGIKMKNKMIENIKDYIELILDDKYLTTGEQIFIVRAYTFIDKTGKAKTIVTEIPFKYIKLTESFEVKNNSYPLSHVMSPLDSDKTVSELDLDVTNKYYFNYSSKAFDEVEQYFND